MVSAYKTISGPSEGLYKDKGSKFLSFALPVRSEAEVKALVLQYRKEYFDARHVCYAYVLGPDRALFRAQDDGEPSGTAGRPILGQINSLCLTDVLVVVVRYFGGILLGTSGLIVAYREATRDALQRAEVVERELRVQHRVRFPYELTQTVMRYLKEAEARQVQADYSDTSCSLLFEVSLAREQGLLSRFQDLYGAEMVLNY